MHGAGQMKNVPATLPGRFTAFYRVVGAPTSSHLAWILCRSSQLLAAPSQKLGKQLLETLQIGQIFLKHLVDLLPVYIQIVMDQNVAETDHPEPSFP